MSERLEHEPPQKELKFSAREISILRNLRQDFLKFTVTNLQPDMLRSNLKAGIRASREASTLSALEHALGIPTNILYETLEEQMNIMRSAHTEDFWSGNPHLPKLRSIEEIKIAQELLKKRVEDPIRTSQRDTLHRKLHGDTVSEDIKELWLKENAEGDIDAYNFMLGENNWIAQMIEDAPQ